MSEDNKKEGFVQTLLKYMLYICLTFISTTLFSGFDLHSHYIRIIKIVCLLHCNINTLLKLSLKTQNYYDKVLKNVNG